VRATAPRATTAPRSADRAALLVDHLEAEQDVAEQLAGGGVREPGLGGDLADLADVVDEGAGDEEVAVDHVAVVGGEHVTEPGDGDGVLEQAANVGVVVALGGGRLAEPLAGLGLGPEQRAEQLAERLLADGPDELHERGVERGGVARSARHEEAEVGGLDADAVELVHVERALALEDLDAAVHADVDAGLGDGAEPFGVLPYAGLDGAVQVAELEAEVGLVVAGPGGHGAGDAVAADDATATRVRRWESFLHLAPDIEVHVTGPGAPTRLQAKSPEDQEVQLHLVSLPGSTQAQVVKGSEEPYLGWTTSGWNTVVPTPVLVREFRGRMFDVLTLIASGGERSVQAVALSRRGMGSTTELVGPRERTSVWFPDDMDKAPVVKFINNLLTDAVVKGFDDAPGRVHLHRRLEHRAAWQSMCQRDRGIERACVEVSDCGSNDSDNHEPHELPRVEVVVRRDETEQRLETQDRAPGFRIGGKPGERKGDEERQGNGAGDENHALIIVARHDLEVAEQTLQVLVHGGLAYRLVRHPRLPAGGLAYRRWRECHGRDVADAEERTTMTDHDDQTAREIDLAGAEKAVADLLDALGYDTRDEVLAETPRRVAEAFSELLTPSSFRLTTFPNLEGYDELILAKDIPFHSLCMHHLLPFVGVAHIAYIPKDRLLGLSKLARIVDLFARDLQVQERMTAQIANWLQSELEPKGVGVVLEAEHMCMSLRGVQKPGHRTVTSTRYGVIRNDPRTREEFLSLVDHAKRR
jgi:GTP cyclohydrolase IA